LSAGKSHATQVNEVVFGICDRGECILYLTSDPVSESGSETHVMPRVGLPAVRRRGSRIDRA